MRLAGTSRRLEVREGTGRRHVRVMSELVASLCHLAAFVVGIASLDDIRRIARAFSE